MPILLGHILKIVTQAILLPIAQKAAEYFIKKIENHDKKVQEKSEKKKIE